METFFLVSTSPAGMGRLAFLPGVITFLFSTSSDGGLLQSETLKYLYLLFSEDTLLPLEGSSVCLFRVMLHADARRLFADVVFNTEVLSARNRFWEVFG
jgi:hypothetical protein